jgi:hypothetical protein
MKKIEMLKGGKKILDFILGKIRGGEGNVIPVLRMIPIFEGLVLAI